MLLAFCSSVGNRALAGTVYGTSGVQLPSRHTTGGWLESCWQGVNRCGPVCRVVFGLRLTGTLWCWFWFTMAVLDNHSWQYAQAGRTLIRLSGRVLPIINVFCCVYLVWFDS